MANNSCQRHPESREEESFYCEACQVEERLARDFMLCPDLETRVEMARMLLRGTSYQVTFGDVPK